MAVSRCIAVTVTYYYYYIYHRCMTIIEQRLLFSPTIYTHSNQPQQPSSPLPSISGKIRVLPVVYRIYSAPAQQVMSPGHAPTSCCALNGCTEVKGSNLTLSLLYSLRTKRDAHPLRSLLSPMESKLKSRLKESMNFVFPTLCKSFARKSEIKEDGQ